ncbi:T9SS type A sorting domain-containing protein [Nostoc ellipsosporum NOK]|nr:T9SS type A sorting domain-containing protein [Nostoc ellipsosporum NOK]
MKKFYLAMAGLLCLAHSGFAQSPGLIIRPAPTTVTSLNPDGNGWCTSSAGRFISDDIAESEIPFKVVPAAVIEPTGDLQTGPSGGFTDIVTRVDGSGFYLYKDAANIYFRLRIGSISSGSKGYTVLIDTDGRMGATGPNADPNYVAPSGNNPGNPGFEYEVLFATNFQVSVFSIDGTATPGTPVTFSLATNSQVSVAQSTDGNNADYFYDWFVPLSAIGNPSSIRVAVTTVTSPNSCLQGSRSDIYGIDDAVTGSTSTGWQTVVNAQPPINLNSFTGAGATCTAAPEINAGIVPGTNVAVTGTWQRMAPSKPGSATIQLYKNGSPSGTAVASTGGTWSISVSNISSGDQFYAKAQASGESSCLSSATIIANGCLVPPAAPVVTCGSLKGISGTMPAGATVLVYMLPTTAASPFSNQMSASNITYGSSTFAYFTSGCSGGNNNVAVGQYMVITQNGGCLSEPFFVCVSSGSSGAPAPLAANGITLTTPLYPATGITLNGAGASSGQVLRLFINGVYHSSITASGSNFSFTGVDLKAGDQLRVYGQVSTNCLTQSSSFNVNCFAEAPVILTTATGNLVAGATTISGRAAYAGATVQLYKGTYPSGIATGATATVSAGGSWSVTTPALTANDVYYALLTYGGCTSAASNAATVLTAAACPTITNSYTDAATSITGTMPSSFTGTIRLYADGALIGSQSVTASSTWTFAVPAYSLYYGAVVTATAQATGGAESNGCSSILIGCTPPAVPAVTPLNSSISVNQSVNYTVGNVTPGAWYSVTDATGSAFAISQYRSSSAGFSFSTLPFQSPGTYTLQVTADALTGCPSSTTQVTVVVNTTLPVRLIQFAGVYNNGGTDLSWTTAQEQNTERFAIEYSADGQAFREAGSVAAQNTAGTHQYKFRHEEVLQKTTYFRLRMIDKDGRFTYSQVVRVEPDKSADRLQITPNPVVNELIVRYATADAQVITITLYESGGRILKQWEKKAGAGENVFNLGNHSGLPQGIYNIRVDDPKGKQLYVRFYKN